MIHDEGAHASPTQYITNNSPGRGSVLHYTDAGLSMELRGLLNGSIVDPSASQQSFTGSLVPMEGATSILDIRADQQVSFLLSH